MLFKKFIEGKTGFPIVDAAMRQIATIGWMHNRLRMIVASFLTKNLNMDWRVGEEYFAQNLMDYELASNVGGWQWSSSTGADPQPYFRMFNPWLQGKKFDPDASFIKYYVPELKDLSPEEIHDPKKLEASLMSSNYYKPIIDYYETRDTTLSLFRSIKQYLVNLITIFIIYKYYENIFLDADVLNYKSNLVNSLFFYF